VCESLECKKTLIPCQEGSEVVDILLVFQVGSCTGGNRQSQ